MTRSLLPSVPRRRLLRGCLLLLGLAGGGTPLTLAVAQPPAPAASAPEYTYAGTLERHRSVTSRVTGITYPYHVYLPAGYATSGRRYPVIYATDGQWGFRAFSRMLDERRKAMILVHIEQGGPGRREVDYAPEGAPAYGRFLREELVPLIESSYRTVGPRTFSGTSYGALLGAILLSQEDMAQPFFSNYLLFDGSFWALTDANLHDEERHFAANARLPVKLLLTSANAPGNVNEVKAFEARYRSRAYQGLVIQRKDFDVAHDDVSHPSFGWAIDQLD